MLVPILLFAAGLICLIKGGDWFVEGAIGIARRFHVSELLIGATVVSIGTTLPEVMVSTASAVGGHSEMAYGNAIGSVICNSALIAAVSIAVRPGKADPKRLRIPVAFFFAAAAAYAVFSYSTGFFPRVFGIGLLLMFAAYIIVNVFTVKRMTSVTDEAVNAETEVPERKLWQDILLLVVGAALIAVGARLLIDNGILIAQALGVPESVIGLTFVALGTSLPELVTAITSLVKGHSELSLGNIAGANLFNLVLVCGLSITVAPFRIPQSASLWGHNASLIFELPVMILVMLLLTVPPLIKGKTYRWQGILMLAVYAGFCIVQFSL